MDRRNFFRILSATSAGVLSTGCGNKGKQLMPLLVPEHEIVPGEEQWHPAVCTECSAACGTLVRIMEGVRVVDRSGERVRERIAAIKKIEGNPLDPVSGGRLCARGQAAVQGLYHPDRLRGPLKRTGDRGSARFAAASWDEALSTAAGQIAKARAADPGSILFIAGPQTGMRSLAIEKFMQALGAPAPVVCSLADFAVERKAAELVFGWQGLPVYDVARAHHLLGVGADFLGGWISPVYYARQFGNFRQGRPEVRGRFVHAESRLSLTAAAADRWLPLRPGTEPLFLAAVGRMLLDSGAARNREQLPKSVADGFQSADAGALLAQCGLDPQRLRDVVKELGSSEAPLVVCGASVPHSNSVDAVMASHYINVMLGSVGKLVLAPQQTAASRPRLATSARPKVVLIDAANPAYTMPRSSGVADLLAHAETVISFAPFIDDSAALADIILPGHHPLESEAVVAPASAPQSGFAVAIPFVQPLYDTRPLEQTLADLAKHAGVEYQRVTAKDVIPPANLDDAARQGGFWQEAKSETPLKAAGTLELRPADFTGDPSQFPLQFQPYLSLQYNDGSGANLPWLQELPDPASSSIWGLPVEIDPKTAARLRIANGDVVRVESPHGSIEAPAYVHPGAVPDVISMPIGDGHSHYGQYASGRGANPLSILAPVWEKSSGALAMGATRVRLARVGPRRGWIQFAAPDREERTFDYR